MNKYVAFIRGINVGGRGVVKMDDLRRAFAGAGCERVTTYVQSGNVIFEASAAATGAMTAQIGQQLHQLLGGEATVLLRTFREVEDIVELEPFRGAKVKADAKRYVTFLATKPRRMPGLPLSSPKGDIEVVQMKGLEVFCLSRMKGGRYGFPNGFIEKELGVLATTRNWTTVSGIVGLKV